MLADVGSKLAIIFVARDVGQAFIVELVMVERRTCIVADVLLKHFASAGLGLVHGDEAGDEGLRCAASIHREEPSAVVAQFSLCSLPGFLRARARGPAGIGSLMIAVIRMPHRFGRERSEWAPAV